MDEGRFVHSPREIVSRVNAANIEWTVMVSGVVVKGDSRDYPSKIGRWVTLAALAVGVVVRLEQYAANPSIWVDEAAIARNVLDRQPRQLFDVLDYGQVAPPGFLLAVKLSVLMCGSSEYALRVVPFVAGLVSLGMFLVVARSVLRPVGAVVATLMFSLAIPFVLFAANLKPYSSDVLVTLFVTTVVFRLQRSVLTRRSALAFALVSVPLLFCSQVAVFSLTAAGVVIAVDVFVRRRADRWYRVAVVVFWALAVVATVGYGAWSMTTAGSVYVRRFWQAAFMPQEGALWWLWTTTCNVFAGPSRPDAFDGSLHYAWPAMFVALLIVGTVAKCAERVTMGAVLVGPVLLSVLAAAIGVYPLGTRLNLFLLPLLLLLVVAGAEHGGRWVVHRRYGEYVSVLLLPFAITTFVRYPLPIFPEHLRPVMRYVADNWKMGDAVWVYYGAGQAFQYYIKRIPLAGDIHIGDCNRVDPREYLHQVDVVRGRPRVWVLMAHGSGAFRFDERKLLTDYLETIGTRLDDFHAPAEDNSPRRAEVILYDLSRGDKLAVSSADRFEIRNPYPSRMWTCYGTMSPLGPRERIAEAVMNE